jgi:hypothetical protein
MISEEKLEAYRNMTVEERWHEVEALMDFACRCCRSFHTQKSSACWRTTVSSTTRVTRSCWSICGGFRDGLASPAGSVGCGCRHRTLKLIAGRRKDMADVEEILAVRKHTDWSYLRRWAVKLNLADRLAQFPAPSDDPQDDGLDAGD